MSYTCVFLILIIGAISARSATILTVGTTTDGTETSPLTLRAAINKANNDATAADFPYIINLPAGTYTLSNQELVIGPNVGTGLGNNVIISGASAASTIINQTGGQSRLFFLDPYTLGNSTFAFNNLTLENGNDTYPDSYSSQGLGGGAINAGDVGSGGDVLNLTNCVLINNKSSCSQAGPGGAAICFIGGKVTLVGCIFSNNVVAAASGAVLVGGGAIYYGGETSGDTLNVRQCSFFNNSVTGYGTFGATGGAIECENFKSVATVENLSACVFQGNTVNSGSGAGEGGALSLDNSGSASSAAISGSTFVNNSCYGSTNMGGAIYSYNPSDNITYCRLAGNTAGLGSEIDNASGAVVADDDWWGNNADPAGTFLIAGAVTDTPYLVFNLSASSAFITTGGTNVLIASFSTNSAGTAIPLANLGALTNVPVTFSGGPGGSISAAQPVIEGNGMAIAYFTAKAPGTCTPGATVDSQTVNATISVVNPESEVKVAGISATSASLDISGGVGLMYFVQASEDLHSWTTIGSTPIPAGGVATFSDPNAPSYPHRFYRAVYP